MSAATATIHDKNKTAFFEALKKMATDSGQAVKAAAIATGHGIKKTASTVAGAVTTGLAWIGNGLTMLGRMTAQTAKIGVSLAALGIDVTVSYVGMAALFAIHASYKVVYGLGMMFTLPAIYSAWGSLGVSRAWGAYKAMWTPKGWKYYSGRSYYSTMSAAESVPTPDDDIPDNVYDIKTGKKVRPNRRAV